MPDEPNAVAALASGSPVPTGRCGRCRHPLLDDTAACPECGHPHVPADRAPADPLERIVLTLFVLSPALIVVPLLQPLARVLP